VRSTGRNKRTFAGGQWPLYFFLLEFAEGTPAPPLIFQDIAPSPLFPGKSHLPARFPGKKVLAGLATPGFVFTQVYIWGVCCTVANMRLPYQVWGPRSDSHRLLSHMSGLRGPPQSCCIFARILRQVPFFPENPTYQHDFPGKRVWPGWLPPEKV
jgi:hypothetical protein